jgi:hypothetical protein
MTDPGDHDDRSGRSRCADLRDHDAPKRALGTADDHFATLRDSRDAFWHHAIILGRLRSGGVLPGPVRFLRLHLARDNKDPWRRLDVGLAEAQLAALTDDPALARSAATHLRAALTIGDDPRLLLVVALGLASCDATIGGQRSWARSTDGKREVEALLVRACDANRAAPIAQFVRFLRSFVSYASSYPGYTQLVDPNTCGGDSLAP